MKLNPNIIKNDLCDWLRTHNIRFPVTKLVNTKINLACSTSYAQISRFSDLSEVVRRERLSDIVALLKSSHTEAFGFRPVSLIFHRWSCAPFSQAYDGNIYKEHLFLINQLKALSSQLDLKSQFTVPFLLTNRLYTRVF